MTPDWSCDSED